METIYKLHFDWYSIRLNENGDVKNSNDCIVIAEYEWNSDTETEGKFIRSLNENLSFSEMETLDGVFETPEEAFEAFDNYLDEYKDWKTIYHGYYEPDEYICTGLIDREESYYNVIAWNAVQKH